MTLDYWNNLWMYNFLSMFWAAIQVRSRPGASKNQTIKPNISSLNSTQAKWFWTDYIIFKVLQINIVLKAQGYHIDPCLQIQPTCNYFVDVTSLISACLMFGCIFYTAILSVSCVVDVFFSSLTSACLMFAWFLYAAFFRKDILVFILD